ncbi:hypothetical protein HRbin40_01955 [bacterium HR40]|nr:hypothetical protein HRbin40_01955 [bacterium HR40]
MVFADRVWGVLALLGGLAIIFAARSFPVIPGQAYGSALVPTLIGVGFLLCGTILIVGDLRRSPRPPVFHLDPEAGSPSRLLDVLSVPAAVLAFILLLHPLGFVPVATLVVGGLIWRFRRGRPLSALITAVTFALFTDWLFRHLLLVPLPLGLLSSWLG